MKTHDMLVQMGSSAGLTNFFTAQKMTALIREYIASSAGGDHDCGRRKNHVLINTVLHWHGHG
jgi:hypothetical protein